jgi:hypothetical protein
MFVPEFSEKAAHLQALKKKKGARFMWEEMQQRVSKPLRSSRITNTKL